MESFECKLEKKLHTNEGQPPYPFFFFWVLGLKNLSKYQSSHLYVGKDDHSVENLRTFKVPLSLRAVLSTSRRKEGFLLFFAHERGSGHMFQK